jgi:asparagine synthase (glutamine-hydrolysing)
MCGIAGYFCKSQVGDSRIHKTLNLMRNRGPDNQDFRVFRTSGEEKFVGLLHSRLSIIDLDSRSNQPFTIGTHTIIFNGEIYNYLELRDALHKRGISLNTSSDTEVLLHYFRIYGKKCVDFLEGMWAFAVYDSENETLFLSRDRFAEKPLYYYEDNRGFYFGSEIKFLKCLSGKSFSVNYRHLMRHMAHGYKALYKSKETYFEDVRELRYAENLTLSSKKRSNIKRYWSPNFKIDDQMTQKDAINGAKAVLLNSVKIRLRADVPIAFCLSGGVDSAGIASIAAKEFNAKITTFSIIDKDERYNEKDNIMSTVEDLGCDYHLISAEQNNPLERLRDLIEYHDAPIATISYFVHSMISEAVHQGGFRVSFSGTSADELFTGYYDHFILHLNEMRSEEDYPLYLQDWTDHVGRFVRNPDLKNPNLYHQDPHFRAHIFDASDELKGFFLKPFIEDFVEENFTDSLLRNRMLNELFHEATPVILHEDDLNSMYYSVENRSPYLDRNLLGFVNSIPSRHLIKNGYGKYILRKALKGTLNEQVRLDRRKKGFNASINSIVKLDQQETRDYLLDPSARIFEIIDRKQIISLIDKFPIPNHLSKFIFNFINARIFLELN